MEQARSNYRRQGEKCQERTEGHVGRTNTLCERSRARMRAAPPAEARRRCSRSGPVDRQKLWRGLGALRLATQGAALQVSDWRERFEHSWYALARERVEPV